MPTAIERNDQGFPGEAVLCTDLGGTVVVSGTGFSPLPVDVLTDSPGVALPTITVVGSETAEASNVTYDPATGALSASIPTGLMPPLL